MAKILVIDSDHNNTWIYDCIFPLDEILFVTDEEEGFLVLEEQSFDKVLISTIIIAWPALAQKAAQESAVTIVEPVGYHLRATRLMASLLGHKAVSTLQMATAIDRRNISTLDL
jgi:hypothetical protein